MKYSDLSKIISARRLRLGLIPFRTDEVIALKEILNSISTNKAKSHVTTAILETVINGKIWHKDPSFVWYPSHPYAEIWGDKVPIHKYREPRPPKKVVVPILDRFGDPKVLIFESRR